jgi:hypothetical protein
MDMADGRDYSQDISENIFNKLFNQRNINLIVELWNRFKLGISKKIDYLEKIKSYLLKNQEDINSDIVQFIVEQGIDDVYVYFALKDSNSKEALLDEWNITNKTGKIVDVIKHMLSNELNCFEDIETIKSMIARYNINDYRLNTFMRMKAYGLIETGLFELKANDENMESRLISIIDHTIDFKLEDRLLSDNFLMEQIEPIAAKSIPKILLEKSDSEQALKSFWERVEQYIEEGNNKEIEKQLEILIPFITYSEKRTEWFLQKLETKRYDSNMMTLFIEICFQFIKKYKISINQYETEKRHQEINKLYEMGHAIKDSLGSLEKTIMRINDDSREKSILINIVKTLRRDLVSIGIKTAEEVDNYGKVVQFDSGKHKYNPYNTKAGIIEILGIKIGDESISLSELNIQNVEVRENE